VRGEGEGGERPAGGEGERRKGDPRSVAASCRSSRETRRTDVAASEVERTSAKIPPGPSATAMAFGASYRGKRAPRPTWSAGSARAPARPAASEAATAPGCGLTTAALAPIRMRAATAAATTRTQCGSRGAARAKEAASGGGATSGRPTKRPDSRTGAKGPRRGRGRVRSGAPPGRRARRSRPTGGAAGSEAGEGAPR